MNQLSELMWVVRINRTKVDRLRIETIESMTKQVMSCGAGLCTLTDDESEWSWSVHNDQ